MRMLDARHSAEAASISNAAAHRELSAQRPENEAGLPMACSPKTYSAGGIHPRPHLLAPLSDDVTIVINNKFDYSKAIIYKTVCSDLSDLSEINYDMIIFFSPSGVKSLYHNFPDFKTSAYVLFTSIQHVKNNTLIINK